MNIKQSGGISFIEVIIAMVILSVSLTGLLKLYFSAQNHHINPIISAQSQWLAQSIIDEEIVTNHWKHCQNLTYKNKQNCHFYGHKPSPMLEQPYPYPLYGKLVLGEVSDINQIMMRPLTIIIYLNELKVADITTWVAI